MIRRRRLWGDETLGDSSLRGVTLEGEPDALEKGLRCALVVSVIRKNFEPYFSPKF